MLSQRQHKLQIRNEHCPLLTMWLEPWGEDYWLRQGETFEIVAQGAEDNFYFHVDIGEKDNVLVSVEGDFADISVRHGEKVLECGHNRP